MAGEEQIESIYDVKVDSEAGARIMMDTARACGFILGPWYKRIAEKHGVSTEGVLFYPLRIPTS